MMRLLTLFFLLVVFKANAHKAAPTNDELINAINISATDGTCSTDQAYGNIEATTSTTGVPLNWNGAIGKDVWFKFTATKFDVAITVNGRVDGASLNTMLNPLVSIYTNDPLLGGFVELSNVMVSSSNVTSINKGGLTVGQVYYIRVSAANNNEGTFKLCVDNYFPPLQPGQDCGTVSILCGMDKFTQLNVTGAGTNNREIAGTCLQSENNAAWYMWTAAKSGAFTFLITPTVTTNDIDWVLYDLGAGGTCANISAATAIRCAAGSGVQCPPSETPYYITGLSMTETDLNESLGCGPNKNGLVRFVDMVAGHTYALLVDNFTGGNNGFSLEFGGDTEFIGPTSEIKVDRNDACTPTQSYTFTSLATNATALKWTFGEGASIATATGPGPYTVTYTTSGDKTVVLEATGTKGCNVVSTQTFFVATKPTKPIILPSSIKLCYDDILKLSTPTVNLGSYFWTGPNGFTSAEQNPEIRITGPENSGDYTVYTKVGDCTSELTTLNIPLIDTRPEAFFDISIYNQCLPNQNYVFINKSLNFTSFVWDFNGGLETTDANGDKRVTFTTNGLKTITLTVSSPNGCTSTLSKEINVQLKPATPIITANQPKFCIGDTMKFAVEEVEGVTYEWIGPNNFKANTAAIEIPVNDFNVAGKYQVLLKIGACVSDVAEIIIPPIAKIPVAAFGTDPLFNSKFTTPLPIFFKNNSKDADTYLWEFGDGNTSTEANPTHIYKTSGTFKVKLTAFADEGCSNSVQVGDLIILDAALFIPNTFSPNQDGINDEFVVTVLNLKKYELFIYNRLGENVFQTSNIFNNWNGKHKNQDVPVSTYYYVIFGKNIYNQDVKYTGSLTLIR
ncbi:MAG: PKD domain-containing protein [Bacteroidota bacterium]